MDAELFELILFCAHRVSAVYWPGRFRLWLVRASKFQALDRIAGTGETGRMKFYDTVLMDRLLSHFENLRYGSFHERVKLVGLWPRNI
jgi:hypothetical protein